MISGKAVLILTSTESSDSSYYGEQGLHFMGTNGESCIVPLGMPLDLDRHTVVRHLITSFAY